MISHASAGCWTRRSIPNCFLCLPLASQMWGQQECPVLLRSHITWENRTERVWQYTPVILPLLESEADRLWIPASSELKVNLCNLVRSCLKIEIKQKNRVRDMAWRLSACLTHTRPWVQSSAKHHTGTKESKRKKNIKGLVFIAWYISHALLLIVYWLLVINYSRKDYMLPFNPLLFSLLWLSPRL